MFLKRINKLDWNTKWNRRINGKRCTLLLPVTSDAWKPELGASASPVCAECKCGHCPGDENPRSRVPKTRVQASVGWRWLPGVSGHSRYGFIHEHTKPSAVVSLCWITPLLSEGWGAFKLDESGLSKRLLSILWGSHKQKRIPGTEHLSFWDSRWLHHHCGWEPRVPAAPGGEPLTWDWWKVSRWSASFPPLGNPRHREARGTVCRREQSILVKANAAQHKDFSVISAQA